MAAGARGAPTPTAPGPAGAASGSAPGTATAHRERATRWRPESKAEPGMSGRFPTRPEIPIREAFSCSVQAGQRGAQLLWKQFRVPTVQPTTPVSPHD